MNSNIIRSIISLPLPTFVCLRFLASFSVTRKRMTSYFHFPVYHFNPLWSGGRNFPIPRGMGDRQTKYELFTTQTTLVKLTEDLSVGFIGLTNYVNKTTIIPMEIHKICKKFLKRNKRLLLVVTANKLI